MIDIAAVRLGEEEEKMVIDVLRSGRLAQGPVVASFERAFARLAGTNEAVAVSSGAAALLMALQCLGLEPGSEVITSPLTFGATLNAILQTGLSARFADISEDDFTIDPAAVEAAATPQTRVILPVHLYGLPADMTALEKIAQDRGLLIIEDAAQAHGALMDDKPVGSFGLGCFSFYATKNVTTGEGGMITSDDEDLIDNLKLIRNQGMRNRYEYETLGSNYRMTEIQAALGVAQLTRLHDITLARQRNAEMLSSGLAGVTGLVPPSSFPGRTHVYHQYTVRVTAEAAMSRDQLATQLANRGIMTGVHYPRLVFDYKCFRDHPRVSTEPMPRAEQAAREVLSLPVHPWLSESDLNSIIDAIRALLKA